MRVSIRNKIIFLVAIPVFLAFVLILGHDFLESRREARVQVAGHLRELARHYAREFDARLRQVAEVAETTRDFLELNPDLSAPTIYAQLRRNVTNNPLIYGASVAFAPGAFQGLPLFAPYARESDEGIREMDVADGGYDYTSGDWEWWSAPEAEDRPVWTRPYFDEGAGDIWMSTYSVPFYREGRFAGVVTVDIQLVSLQQHVYTPEDAHREFMVLTPQGEYVFHNDPQRIGRSVNMESSALLGSSGNVKDAPSTGDGGTVAGPIRVEEEGMTLWRFAAPIASAGWTFIAQLPEDDALSLVHHQARRATAGLALALLLILVGIWIAAGRIARPLARLEVAAREIAQGNLTLSLWSDSRDEIGNLTRSFGDMAQRLSEREGQLRDLNRNLEHRVEDRTRALADAEERSRLLLDSAGEGIFGVGPDGCLSFINPAGARMLGYRAEELVGREIHPLIHHSFRSGSPYPVEACPMHRAHTQGVAGKVDDEVLWRRDGSNFDVEYTSRPIRKDGDLVGAVVVFRDVSELLALNRNFVALLENTPDFIYIKDTEHRITACSRSIASLTGHRDWRELIGKTNSDIFPREQAEKYDHLEREVIAKGREQLNHEATYQDHNGELRWVRTNQHPIRDQTGNIAGMFGISTDITAIKHLAQDLEQARDAAEQANRAKSDFLANMSHEIRTPMNAVIGMTHLCLQTNLSGKQRGYLEKVQEAARGLLGIINDILDFSKIEAGKLDMELSPFDLEEVLEKVTSLIGLKARDKGLELLLDLEQAVPRGLVGDPLRLGQVLINLANNAVKFTDSGEIVIGVCVEREDPERVTLAFSVRDTGIGIPPETQARLFRSFTQADSSTTRKYGGSGLGLTICKRLVGMMQGTIGVASIVGEGSDFHFTASFGRQPEAAQGRPSRVELSGSHALVGDDDSGARAARRIEEQEAMSQLRGSRVLLVEDNAINQEVAVEILSGAGVEVRTANDGVEALEALKEERFDGVLMDVQMPRLDGYEATRAIRRDPEHRDLPIVAMTASAMAGDREKALQAGMNDHLPKPIDVEELFSIMSKWMRPAAPGVQPLLETGVPRKGEPPDLPHLPGLNMREALARLRGNRDLYRRLLVRFSEEQCHFPENYRAALAAGDRETAIRLAHTLKGVAGNLGAEPLQALAETLEQRTRRGEDAGGTLEDAETDLRELLAGIEAVQRPNEEARPALTEVAAADLEALGEEISRLASCLEDFDAAAIGIFEGIRQQLAAVVSRTKLDRLQRELDGFDFPQALDTLNSLAAEMGTDLSSG